MATSEIGSSILSAFGSSSFDVAAISKALAEAEVAGQRSIIQKKEDKTNTELSGLSFLKQNLSAFQTYITDLSDPATFNNRSVTSSNPSVVTATTASGSPSGTYQVIVNQLAQSHTQVSNKTYSSLYSTVSTGTLNIDVGGNSKSLVIDGSNNTLEGLRNAINNGDYGVNASIVNSGGQYQLMFTSKTTGADGEVSLSGLSDFDTLGLSTTVNAQDAEININGLSITSSTNTLDSVLDGVTLNLQSADPGKTQTITIANDNAGITESVSSFVSTYNQLDKILDTLGSYDDPDPENPDDEYKGKLAGNPELANVRNAIREALTGSISGISGSYTSLVQIGITTNLDGTMSLDESQLANALNTNINSVAQLFSKGGNSPDALISGITGSEETKAGSYALNVTTAASRAQLDFGAYSVTNFLATDKLTSSTNALNIGAGAAFDMTFGGETFNIALNSGSYASLADVATEFQTQINSAGFAAGTVGVSYNAQESRFDFLASNGTALSLANVVGLSAQGLGSTAYASTEGVSLLNGASMDIDIDTSSTTSISLQGGMFTLAEFKDNLQDAINNNSDVKTANASVIIEDNGTSLSMLSNRWGSTSQISITNAVGLGNTGVADAADTGDSVEGTLTMSNGATVDLGAYVDQEDGRKVVFSNFVMDSSGAAADVRGLEFSVLGGAIGARGPVNYTQGFADRLNNAISALLDTSTGSVSRRITSLDSTIEELTKKKESIDSRYDILEMRYRMQFQRVSALMQQMSSTSTQLAATFKSLSSSGSN